MRLQPLVDAMQALLLTRPVLHADETPVPMLKTGLGKTHRAYLWSYATSEYDELKAVIYDFAEGRGGVYAREFLGVWSGKLVCDDYAGYKALFDRGVIEAGCMAHARRKLHDLYANHRSEIAEEGLRYFAALHEIEREAREAKLTADGRQQLRQRRAKPVAEALRQGLTRHGLMQPVVTLWSPPTTAIFSKFQENPKKGMRISNRTFNQLIFQLANRRRTNRG